ncbi:MAG: TetR/AcrR family transcriptional regulator [Sphingomonadales bacterium]|nr:TetR/AcrR family transcriptional regulator [Sphingomonadales bacterium]
MARQRTTTPRKPDDARAHRSVEALRTAFLSLIETRPFESVTIRDITAAAGVSYPTFFRRFAGKDELLADIATAEVRHLLALGAGAMGTPGASSPQAMCDHVAAHRRLWCTLLTGGAASAMREEFMAIVRDMAASRPRINPWIPVDLAVPFVAAGLFEILSWWMRQPADYPVANVVTLIDALVVDVTARPRPITLA